MEEIYPHFKAMFLKTQVCNFYSRIVVVENNRDKFRREGGGKPQQEGRVS